MPSGARKGTAKPLGGAYPTLNASLALQAGNRLWHPLIAHYDLALLCNVEGGTDSYPLILKRVPRLAALIVHFLFLSKGAASPALRSALAPPLDH